MDNPLDACANAEFLLRVLDDITQSIFISASACPMYVCVCVCVCLILFYFCVCVCIYGKMIVIEFFSILFFLFFHFFFFFFFFFFFPPSLSLDKNLFIYLLSIFLLLLAIYLFSISQQQNYLSHLFSLYLFIYFSLFIFS